MLDEDLYNFIQQLLLIVVSGGGGVSGMVYLLEAGYNEWLSYLLPLFISVPLAFLACYLMDFIVALFYKRE